MSIRDDIKSIRPGFWVLVGLTVVFLYFLNVSWLKWGNLIVDSYRDAWLAENLLKGKVLYRDLFCEYGFLPYYFLAMVFKFFGANGISVALCGIAVTVAVAFFLYKTARLFFDKVVSGLAVFTFLAVFAFGNYKYLGIFNFILPYSIASTFFCFFCTASSYFFLKFIVSDEIIWLKVWSALYGFTFLCRPDIPFFCWAGCAVGILPALWQTRHNKARIISCLFTPLLFTLACYTVFFALTGSMPDFSRQIIGHGLVVKNSPYTLSIMGLDKVGTYFIMMLFSLVLSLAAAASIAGGCVLVHRGTSSAASGKAVYGGGFLIFIAFFSGIFWPRYFLQYYCLTFVLLLNSAYGLYLLKRNNTPGIAGAIFALSVISLTLIMRIIFKPNPLSYGFFLIVGAIPAYYLFFFHVIGGWWKTFFSHFPEAMFKTVLLFFFVMQAYLWWNISQTNYDDKTVKIVFKRGTIYKGTMYAYNDKTTQNYLNAVLYLDKNARPDQTLVVFPEGISVNFFTGLDNPVGLIYFLPTILGSITEEKELIARFIRCKIDYVVLLTRNTFQYGPASFGIDYAKKIAEWVKSNYDLVKVFGDYPYTSENDGIAVYKRHVAQ